MGSVSHFHVFLAPANRTKSVQTFSVRCDSFSVFLRYYAVIHLSPCSLVQTEITRPAPVALRARPETAPEDPLRVLPCCRAMNDARENPRALEHSNDP
jgi:hypothetical protein